VDEIGHDAPRAGRSNGRAFARPSGDPRGTASVGARRAPPVDSWTSVSRAQLGLPRVARGAPPGDAELSDREKLFLELVTIDSWQGRKPCRMSNAELARGIGSRGNENSARREIQNLLHGRTYRKYNPETGKHDGEEVRRSGLVERGFLRVDAGDSSPRELFPTSKWLRLLPRSQGSRDPEDHDERHAPRESPSLVEASSEPEAVDPAPSEAHAVVEAATVEVPVVATSAVAVPAGRPTDAELESVLGRRRNASRPEQAAYLHDKLKSQSLVFKVGDEGRLEQIPHAAGLKPDEAQSKILRWLEPEFLACLASETKPAGAGMAGGTGRNGESKRAPPVLCAGEVSRQIGSLRTEADCRTLARVLASDQGFAYKDADPDLTEKTYLGIALEVLNGALPARVFLDSFEAACGQAIERRGAYFIAGVKRRIGAFRCRAGGG
jgi:hypothetical protein